MLDQLLDLFQPVVLAAVLSVFVPGLTELVTKLNAPSWLKSFVAGLLAATAGVLATVAYDPAQPFMLYVAAVGAAWLVAGRAYAVRFLVDFLGKLAPGFGFGAAPKSE